MATGFLFTQASAQMKETRSLEAFSRLSVSQSIEVELVEGDKEQAVITSEEIDLEDIVTEVSGNKLSIHLDGWNNNWRGSVKIRLTYSKLEEVSVNSSARVFGTATIQASRFEAEASSSGRMELSVDCQNLSVDVSSSGKVTLSGKATNQDVEGSSSGNYDGVEVESDNVRADVSSSGKVYVTVNNELDADVSSSGRVVYQGNPKRVMADQNSSGKVVKN